MSRRRSTGGGAPPTLSEQMEALLLGTNGIALDPTDNATMWLEDTKATQLTGDGQTVGCIRSKWGNTQYDFVQSDPTARPLRTGGKFITPDAVNDFLTLDSAFAALQNAPGYFISCRINEAVAESGNDGLFRISAGNSATGQRVDVVYAAGKMRTRVRRLDADAVTDNFGTTGQFWDATALTDAFSLDLISGAAIKIKNNIDIDTYTHPGSGNSENTASLRVRLFSNLANTAASFAAKPIGRSVVLPWAPSAAERTLVHDWQMEV